MKVAYGHFTIENIPGGPRTLQFSYVGYAIKRVQVKASQSAELYVELTPETIRLSEVIVTPGQFSIMGKGPSVRQTLTEQDLETIPFGEARTKKFWCCWTACSCTSRST